MHKFWKAVRDIFIALALMLMFYTGFVLLKIYLNFTPDSSLELALLKSFGFDSPRAFLSTAIIITTTLPSLILLTHLNSSESVLKIPVSGKESFITSYALSELITSIATSSGGIESVNEVEVDWSKKKGLSISVKVSASSKVDIARVSSRLQERIKQEIEFSLGINQFNRIEIIVEQTEESEEGRKLVYG